MHLSYANRKCYVLQIQGALQTQQNCMNEGTKAFPQKEYSLG